MKIQKTQLDKLSEPFVAIAWLLFCVLFAVSGAVVFAIWRWLL